MIYFLHGVMWALPVAPLALILGGFIAFLQARKEIRRPQPKEAQQ